MCFICDKKYNQSNLSPILYINCKELKTIEQTDFDYFINLNDIVLECNNLEVIESLPKLKLLNLNKCFKLKTINENINLESLYIDDCYKIETLPLSLKNLLIEHGNISFETLSKLINLHNLQYYRCELKKLPPLSKLTTLTIEKSYVSELKGEDYPNLLSLKCKESYYLEDLSNFNKLKFLSCYSCKNLKRIKFESKDEKELNISWIDCSNCLKLEEINYLKLDYLCISEYCELTKRLNKNFENVKRLELRTF